MVFFLLYSRCPSLSLGILRSSSLHLPQPHSRPGQSRPGVWAESSFCSSGSANRALENQLGLCQSSGLGLATAPPRPCSSCVVVFSGRSPRKKDPQEYTEREVPGQTSHISSPRTHLTRTLFLPRTVASIKTPYIL